MKAAEEKIQKKVTVNPKSGEDLDVRMRKEMEKYKSMGYKITAAAHSWFMAEKKK